MSLNHPDTLRNSAEITVFDAVRSSPGARSLGVDYLHDSAMRQLVQLTGKSLRFLDHDGQVKSGQGSATSTSPSMEMPHLIIRPDHSPETMQKVPADKVFFPEGEI